MAKTGRDISWEEFAGYALLAGFCLLVLKALWERFLAWLALPGHKALLTLALLCLAALVWGALRARRGRIHDERHVHGLRVADSAAKGTSRWAADRDVADVCEFGPPNPDKKWGGGIVLGRLKGRIVRAVPEKAPKVKRPAHALAVAGSGGGKTFNFVIPNVIAGACDQESLIITDPKGELAPLLAPWLERKGYRVFVFNLADPSCSSYWNPVLECRGEEELYTAAWVLVQNNPTGRDKSGFFVSLEIQALTAIMALLRADFPKKQAHLRAALSLLSWPKESLQERFDNAYRSGRLGPEGYEAFYGALPYWENAVSGLTSKLAVVRDPNLARLLSRKELDLTLFGREKAALFCVLPVASGHLKPILALFYHFLLERLYSLARSSPSQRLPVPVRLVLDEFANIGQVPKFQEIMATARSLGIRVQYVLQELQQLKDNYPGQDMSILGNTFVKIYLGGSEKPTRGYFAAELGEAAVYAESERRDVTMPWSRAIEVPKRTETIVRRPLMEADELGRLPEGDCVVLVQGHYPLYLQKLGWTELPQAKEIQELAVQTVADIFAARPEHKLELPPFPATSGGKRETPGRERSERGRAVEPEPELEGAQTEGQGAGGGGRRDGDDLFSDLGI